MSVQVITMLPALAIMGWTLYSKIYQRKFTEGAMLSLAAFCVVINTVLVYQMIISDISVGKHIIQMGACSCIIPLFYLYFSLQIGRSKNNLIVVMLWILAVLSFIPNVLVINPFQPFAYPSDPLKPFALYVISGGEKVFAIYMGDLMVALQAILTSCRLIPFLITLRHSGLTLNPRIYAFVIWWILAILATVILSSMTYEDLRSTSGEWFYFTVISLLIISINLLFIFKFDLNTIKTPEGDDVEALNVYLTGQYNRMSEEMKSLVVDGELYTDSECSVEMLVEKLHTNRTYFARMMTSVYGMSFSDYITDLRLRKVEHLIKTSDLPISEIAYSCGYSDAGYMSKKFKEKNGVTPTSFRKSQNRL